MSGMNKKRSSSDSRLNGCMENAIEQLYEQHAMISESSALLGSGVLVVIASMEDLVRTRKVSAEIRHQNMQYAQQRNTNEQIQARGSIESRLLKDPVKTVADLRSSYRGCMDLIGLWSGLGSVLLKKEGWNEMEVKMACSLLGINPLIRCSREWTKLDRGMTADKARPYEALEMNLQSQLRKYSKDFSVRMEELYPDEQSAYAVGLCMMQEWRLGLEYRLEANRYYDLKAYEKWRMDEISSRKYWVDTRRFIARKISELRREAALLSNHQESSNVKSALLKFTAQEMKASEWAQKMVVSAIANVQKSMAMAKSVGLLGDGKAKKAPKPEPVAVVDMEVSAESLANESKAEDVAGTADVSKSKVVKARSPRNSCKVKPVVVSNCKLKSTGDSSLWLDGGVNHQSDRISSPFKPITAGTLCEQSIPQNPLQKQVSNGVIELESGAIIKHESLNRLAEGGRKRQTGGHDEIEKRRWPEPESP